MLVNRWKTLTSVVVGVCMAFQIGTTAFAAEGGTKEDYLSNIQQSKKNYDEAMKDPAFVKKMKEAQNTKTDLAEMQAAEAEIGLSEFWNSVDPNEVKNYYFNADGTVSLKDVSNLSEKEKKEAEKKVKEFEKKFQQFINKIDNYNKKIGVNRKATDSIKNGGLNIGDSTGYGPYNTYVNAAQMVIGDVVLGSRPGATFQGWMEHAGIYKGVNTDLCIWSIPGQGLQSKFQSKSSWGKEYNEIWAMNVWPVTSSQAASAYQHAYNCSYGDLYDWTTDKWNHSWWYCSKIPYVGYLEKTLTDLDGNAFSDPDNYWVFPSDIYFSAYTSTRAYWCS